ncbi:MAG: response regulator [Hyphomicrobiales bacterium]
MTSQSLSVSSKNRPRSLLLSPDYHCRAVLSDLFDDYGYPLTCQSSLKEIVLKGADDGAELVILDDELGDMTPYEALRILRAKLENPSSAKAILLSGGTTRRIVEQARKAGFDAVIAKPIAPTLFLRTLRNLTLSLAA